MIGYQWPNAACRIVTCMNTNKKTNKQTNKAS